MFLHDAFQLSISLLAGRRIVARVSKGIIEEEIVYVNRDPSLLGLVPPFFWED